MRRPRGRQWHFGPSARLVAELWVEAQATDRDAFVGILTYYAPMVAEMLAEGRAAGG